MLVDCVKQTGLAFCQILKLSHALDGLLNALFSALNINALFTLFAE